MKGILKDLVCASSCRKFHEPPKPQEGISESKHEENLLGLSFSPKDSAHKVTSVWFRILQLSPALVIIHFKYLSKNQAKSTIFNCSWLHEEDKARQETQLAILFQRISSRNPVGIK